MSEATDFAENEIADWIGGNGAPAAVTNVYVKLHIGAPGETATANAAAETLRVLAAFGAASGGVVSITGNVSWTSVSTTETISHVSIWDALTVGNALAHGALASSVSLTAGDDFDLTALDITVT